MTIDTFRADRLTAEVTPNLYRLAERGTIFTSARATVPLTLPSHTTILTGLLPPAHGVRENGLDRLSEKIDTIATMLKPAGYDTAAFVGAFVLDRRFGLARGFDVYDDRIARDPNAPDRLEAERPASTVIDAALAWLTQRPAPGTERPALAAARQPPNVSSTADRRPPTANHDPSRGPARNAERPAPEIQRLTPSAQRPFFAWIHLYDPHAPYTPPREYAARAKSPYDGELMYADAQIARVLTWLDSAGLRDETVVVVAGDHGEALGDHGESTHGMLLYDSTLRVPLMVVSPKQQPLRRDDAVTLADVAPTLLRLAGLRPPSPMDGRDLFDDGSGHGSQSSSRTLYSETQYPRVAGWSPLQALTDGRWMTIKGESSLELYDLKNDPSESQNVAAAQSPKAQAMAARIETVAGRATASSRPEVSAETAERLRALGYVAGTPQTSRHGQAPNPATHIVTWNRFEEALSSLNGGRPDALTMLRGIAREDPDSFVFATTLARGMREAGDLTGAVAAYRDASKKWPAEPTVFHDLAVAAGDAAAQATGNRAAAFRDEAARAEQAAIALRPDYAAAHNGLGLLAADDGRDADAAREFTRATELDPNNASYWTNLGNARRATNDGPGAEAAYTRALEIDSRASDAANGIGALLVANGRAADAAVWFERALAADPSSIDARLNLGIALQQSGNPARAAAEYRAVLAASPRYAQQRDAARKLLASLGAVR